MKLDRQILKLAHHEAHHHLMSDLNYTMELHRFMKDVIDLDTYLSSDFGFKKFLNDYGVGRTLKAGDDPKLKILSLIKDFQFGKSHVQEIAILATKIQQQGLSSQSGKGGPGLPQSFCSKFLYVLKPDQLIPYDSYVLKSLQLTYGLPLKHWMSITKKQIISDSGISLKKAMKSLRSEKKVIRYSGHK
ncbi:MAG: hypothetical protein IPP15_09580 [Saprospiraceae bacterium]|uniref:Uncharacterized protein n=1 Tax=Candidatus Opimibacter skivensis TaxID=2982028 RepID=A0A9D7XNY1_9BACT|nr:hypothetical protein [Candidatus Opimibacter skivensis]